METKQKIIKVGIFLYSTTLIVLGYLLLKLSCAYIMITVGILGLIHIFYGVRNSIVAIIDAFVYLYRLFVKKESKPIKTNKLKK